MPWGMKSDEKGSTLSSPEQPANRMRGMKASSPLSDPLSAHAVKSAEPAAIGPVLICSIGRSRTKC
jgi:hypothetical protein